jgi:hypothetical protein
MGTTLTGTTPQDTYDSLIKVTDNGPLSGSLKVLTDGLGNNSTLSLSTAAASIAGTLAVTGNATFDTNTLFVDAAANEVGIGTITPSAKLDVDGTSYMLVANNSVGNRKILFGVDAAVGEPAIQGALSNDTARKLLLNPAGGEIIIGANVSDLTRTLAVVGTSGLAVQYASASGTYLDITPNAANGLVTLTADARTGSFPDMTFRTSATERMRILSTGNVGIGTSAPAQKLAVDGNIILQSSTAATKSLIFNSPNSNWTPQNSRIDFIPADGVNAAVEISLNLWDGNGNTNETLRFPASGGIKFPATQISSANANALDDYEEGTWTMGVAFNGASVGLTYSTQAGTYTKIGRQVTLNGRISLSAKGSSTGEARITGLPFTIANTEGNRSVPSLRFANITFANQFQGFGVNNTTQILLQEITEAGADSVLTDADFANNSEIFICFTYFV